MINKVMIPNPVDIMFRRYFGHGWGRKAWIACWFVSLFEGLHIWNSLYACDTIIVSQAQREFREDVFLKNDKIFCLGEFLWFEVFVVMLTCVARGCICCCCCDVPLSAGQYDVFEIVFIVYGQYVIIFIKYDTNQELKHGWNALFSSEPLSKWLCSS